MFQRWSINLFSCVEIVIKVKRIMIDNYYKLKDEEILQFLILFEIED